MGSWPLFPRGDAIIAIGAKFGRRAFSVAGPTAWNSLLDYLD